MSALRNYLDKIKPNFEEGGKLHAFRSVFDGFETFLYIPNNMAGINAITTNDMIRLLSMASWICVPPMRAVVLGTKANVSKPS